jgi:ABC-2 type transport system permease protein
MRFFVIAIKELQQLRRDRLTLAMMMVLPIVQLMLFGYAINTDVRHISTVVFDQDRSAASRDVARALEATGFYDLVGEVSSYDEIDRALRSGRARAALVVPARYSIEAGSGRTAHLQLVLDGSDPLVVSSATEAAGSLISLRSQRLRAARLAKNGAAIGPEPIELVPTILYNQDLRTAVNVVPGLIGVLLTMTMVMLTSMAMARERERGTLEQLIVSPVRPLELIVGKIAPYVGIGYVQMTLILAFGHFVFRVPIVGSIPMLFVLAFLFIAASLAIGLFFSTLAATQQQAMQMSFFFLLPNILLSGFIFPFEAMPRPAQWLSQCLPLTHFMRIVRGVVLKGAGFDDLRGELLWLTAILAVLVALSALRFRKKLV